MVVHFADVPASNVYCKWVEELVRRGQAEGTDARACSVQVAVLLIRKIIGSLSKRERQELAQAFLRNDASNPTYKGFKCMFEIVEQLHVSPGLVSYLNTEVAGQLNGLSQEAISTHGWRRRSAASSASCASCA